MKIARLVVEIQPSVKDTLKQAAASQGTTVSFLIRKLIEKAYQKTDKKKAKA